MMKSRRISLFFLSCWNRGLNLVLISSIVRGVFREALISASVRRFGAVAVTGEGAAFFWSSAFRFLGCGWWASAGAFLFPSRGVAGLLSGLTSLSFSRSSSSSSSLSSPSNSLSSSSWSLSLYTHILSQSGHSQAGRGGEQQTLPQPSQLRFPRSTP